MLPEAVRKGLGNGAMTGVVRMPAIFLVDLSLAWCGGRGTRLCNQGRVPDSSRTGLGRPVFAVFEPAVASILILAVPRST